MKNPKFLIVIMFFIIILTSCNDELINEKSTEELVDTYNNELIQLREENENLSNLIDEMEDNNKQTNAEVNGITTVESNSYIETYQLDKSSNLYDYEQFAHFKESNINDLDIYEIVYLLQSKGLAVLKVDLNDRSLKITYRLDLNYENQQYYFYYNKKVQDSIVILTVFDEIDSVEFVYEIPEMYSASALPYTRDIINKELDIDLHSYDVTGEFIKNELPKILNGFYYNPDIMRFITYEHAMGLD